LRLNPLSTHFRHCEKRGDAAMHIMRKLVFFDLGSKTKIEIFKKAE